MFGGNGYSMLIMNEHLELLDLSVADVLKHIPSTVKFFINQHTDCVGCRLAHFCSLSDVVKTYDLDEKIFLERLSKYNVQTILIRSMK
jgi:hypothetical protein